MKPEGDNPDAPGLKLEGKVVRELADAYVFAVYNDSGQVRIPKSKIKKLDIDKRTEYDDLPEDDFAGRFKIAKQTLEAGKFADAIKMLEPLKGKEGVGKDMLKLLGRAYEQRQMLDKAYENYVDYLKINPDDKEVAAKVDELKKKVNPDPEPGAEPKDTPGKAKVVEGLEANGQWVVENWGHPGTVSIIPDETGKKAVAVQSQGGPDPENQKKCAISRTGQPLNLSDSKEMQFNVLHKSDGPLSMAIAFVNAQGDFYETSPKRIPANTWFPFKLRIDGKVYKSNRNDFKSFSLDLEGGESVKRILFLVYSNKPFTMWLESIYFK
jgi:tetratricopeptide (TPR) repeat protein